MTQQGPPPTRPGKAWAGPDDTGGDPPPWAGPGIRPRVAESGSPGRRSRRGPQPGGRDVGQADGQDAPLPGSRRQRAVARAKRARRTMYLWAAVAVAVIAGAAVAVPRLLPHHRPPAADNLVTTFLPGELRTVPEACKAVTATTLGRYLPGTRRKVVPHSLNGKAESMCDWSVDAPPMYRLLDVTVQAYSPSGLASGNGSATNAAIDAYRQARRQKVKPPKRTHQPAAAMTALPGVGSAAFSALQVPVAGGDTTDLITVVVRQRNVLITVVFDGLAHSPGGRYGHVSVPQLQAGAAAAARDVLAALH